MNDPMLNQLRDGPKAGGKDPRRLLAMRKLFSEELASNQRFVRQLEEALASFYDKGTAATLEEYLGGSVQYATRTPERGTRKPASVGRKPADSFHIKNGV